MVFILGFFLKLQLYLKLRGDCWSKWNWLGCTKLLCCEFPLFVPLFITTAFAVLSLYISLAVLYFPFPTCLLSCPFLSRSSFVDCWNFDHTSLERWSILLCAGAWRFLLSFHLRKRGMLGTKPNKLIILLRSWSVINWSIALSSSVYAYVTLWSFS